MFACLAPRGTHELPISGSTRTARAVQTRVLGRVPSPTGIARDLERPAGNRGRRPKTLPPSSAADTIDAGHEHRSPPKRRPGSWQGTEEDDRDEHRRAASWNEGSVGRAPATPGGRMATCPSGESGNGGHMDEERPVFRSKFQDWRANGRTRRYHPARACSRKCATRLPNPRTRR